MKWPSALRVRRGLVFVPAAAVLFALAQSPALSNAAAGAGAVDDGLVHCALVAGTPDPSLVAVPAVTQSPTKAVPRRGDDAAALNPHEEAPGAWLQSLWVGLFVILVGAAFVLVSPRHH
ncbi:hypothetical protein [Arthrobacter sp. RAF14]|uniref:hypothetical protein n=1 Tax=Arthrobacter sp. RAF14 TaxID=3233051 RepID=UPI003F9073D5